VVIASRALPESNVEIHQPWYRESSGRFFNLLVRLLVLPGLHDTQCGFKVFSARAARDAFGPTRLEGFSFDVEALYVARRRGYRIAEVPVTWRNDAATRVGLGQGARAFADIVSIRLNGSRGLYEVGAL
jgi:dolichyl-phosphate beta-glucosyltransferase